MDGVCTCHEFLRGWKTFREGLDWTHRLLQAGLSAL